MYFSNIVYFCVLLLNLYHIKESKASLITQEVELPPGQDCVMTPVVHILKHPGCQPQLIPSYACVGKCSSYLQVSGSKIWQMERSCNCCQESGEREATVDLYCPEAKREENRYRKVRRSLPKLHWNACVVLVVLLILVPLYHKKRLDMPTKDRFTINSGRAFKERQQSLR
ncbi:cuticle-tanning hormone bursicon isoform X1 [Choristoneura fumiferana]|uniref:cuticle-tanning hormone bursicon isoform X1 n=1 Tax=Choristoneura fumiferana TaxID=7141 RepID=UPI003D15402F